MRRRPMQAWPRGQLNTGGSRALLALVVFALLAMLVPSSAAAATPTISYSIDGIAGTNGWWRGSTHGNYVVLALDRHRQPSADEHRRVRPRRSDPWARLRGVTKTCTATQRRTAPRRRPKTVKVDADPPTGVKGDSDPRSRCQRLVQPRGRGDLERQLTPPRRSRVAAPRPTRAQTAPRSRQLATCRDKAGNVASGAFAAQVRRHAAPTLSKVGVTSSAASDLVRWTSSSATDTAVVQRWPRGSSEEPVVFRGAASSYVDKKIQVGREYVYAIQTTDQAGNASKRITVAGLPKVLTLGKMPYVPRAAPNPILRWQRVRGASYYHVQLFRGSKRILAAWPSKRAAGAPNDLEVGGSPLPAQAREVPLVRLGRHRPPVVREVRPDRQRPLHRSAGIGRCETR